MLFKRVSQMRALRWGYSRAFWESRCHGRFYLWTYMPIEFHNNRCAVARKVTLAIFTVALVLLFISISPHQALAASTHYVATDGTNANPGSETQPWRTIQKAADMAQAGDTIIVKPGTYSEDSVIPASSGTSGALITFKSQDSSNPAVLDGNGTLTYGFKLVSRNYIKVEGFEIRNYRSSGILVNWTTGFGYGMQIVGNQVHNNGLNGFSGAGIYYRFSNGGLIQGNRIYDNGLISAPEQFHGIYYGSAVSLTIKDNVIYNNIADGMQGAGDNVTIDGNMIYGHNNTTSHGDGIQHMGPSDNTVFKNNILYDNAQQLYIDSYGGAITNTQAFNNVFSRTAYTNYMFAMVLDPEGGNITTATFYNNTAADMRANNSGSAFRIVAPRIGIVSDVTLKNNVFYNSPFSGKNGLTIDYNLYYSSTNYAIISWAGTDYTSLTTFKQAYPGLEQHGIQDSPRFVNISSANFGLQPGSPAIDAGISDGAPITDKDGRLRYDDPDTANTGGGGAPYYDMGAYEYQGSGSQTTDTTPPVTFASTNPLSPDGANNWFTTTPLINMSVSEAALTYYQWDSTASGNWQLYLTTPIIAPEGTHTLNFYSVDAANNTESIQNHVYQVDFTSPGDPTISSPSHATGNWSADNTIETSWSGAADAASGVDGYSVAWSNSAVTVPDNVKDMEETSTQATSDSLADGIWYFHVRTKDNAGNWTSTAHFGPFWIDGTGPSGPGTAAEAGGAVNNTWQNNNADPNFSWADAADSAGSGVRGYYYYWGTDPSGNPTNWTTATAFDPPAVPDGSTYYLRLKSEDMVGNRSSASTSFTYKYDAGAPVDPNIAAATPDKDAWTGDATIDISWAGAFDGASGIDGYSIAWSNSATTIPDTVKDMEETSASTTSDQLSNGSWYFHLRTRDSAGNWTSTIHYGPFLINTGLPNTSVAPAYPDGDNTWFKSVPTISLTADQAASTYYSWDSTNTPSAYSTPFQPPGAGQHTLYYYSVSNTNETETVRNRVFKVDSAAPGDPLVSSSSHSAGNWSNDNTVQISLSGATDAISGIDGYSIEWSNSAATLPDTIKDLEETASSTISPPLANGTWYANIRTKDNAGNWTSTVHSGPFKIDSTAPSDTVVLNNGVSYTNSTQVTLGLAATDGSGSGLYKMRFSNDGIFDNQDTMEGWHDYANSLTWALTPGNDTKYVYAQYMDRAGNVSRSFSASILLDSSGPQAAMSAPAYSTNQSNTTNVSLSWSGSDPSPSSNISSFDVQRKDGLRGAWQNWQSATPARSAYMAGLPGHTYYFRVRARDSAENLGGWSAESPVTFPFDSTYPAIRYSTWDWLTYNHNTSQFYRGTSKYSSRGGATVSLRFRGRQIALISAKGPNRGHAAAYIDDRFVGVIDTYAPEMRHRAVVYIYPNNPSSRYERHKLTIRVLRQKNRASRGFRFDIDGFGVVK